MNPKLISHRKQSAIVLLLWIVSIHTTYSQSGEFLDSLFKMDMVGHQQANLEFLEAKADWHRKHKGLSAGFSMNNSEFNLEDNGLSTRLRVDMDILKEGLLNHRRKAKQLETEKTIQSLEGDKNLLNHQYGLYYDYIVLLFNRLKKPILTELLGEARDLAYFQAQLYYNKLITFDDLIDSRGDISNAEYLLQAIDNYDRMCAHFLVLEDLPAEVEDIEYLYNIDIHQLQLDLITPDRFSDVIDMKKDLIDGRYAMQALPRLSLTSGYRIRDQAVGNGRFFVGFRFTKDIDPGTDNLKRLEKEMVDQNQTMVLQQQEKELANLYYEYEYKSKQYQTQQFKLYHHQEIHRIQQIKSSILEVEDKVTKHKNSVDSLKVLYEMVDLRQQLFLKLLKVKKLIHPMDISPYLEARPLTEDTPRFAGNRFYLKKENYSLTAVDLDILENNEIEVIHTSDVPKTREIVLVPIGTFNSRGELEQWIEKKVSTHPDRNFLFTDLSGFKDLELKTLDQPAITWSHK